jgi:hypothetical protein
LYTDPVYKSTEQAPISPRVGEVPSSARYSQYTSVHLPPKALTPLNSEDLTTGTGRRGDRVSGVDSAQGGRGGERKCGGFDEEREHY